MQRFINTFKELTPANIKKIEREIVLGTRGGVLSNTLNSIIAKSYADIYNAKTTKAGLLKIWKNIIATSQNPREGSISRQWISLFETLDKVIKLLYPNEGSMEKVLTEFRRVIKEKYGATSEIYKQSIYKTGISRERSIQKRQEYADKVAAKNINRSELPAFYDDEIYKVIDENAASPNLLNNVVSVLLATGSRFIEVLKVSEYSATDKDNYIKIKGIAKDKGDQGYDNKIVIRPLNRLTADQVIQLVKKIRNGLNLEGDNRTISDRYNTQMNRIVKNLFKDRPITTHKLRYIASNLAYLTYSRGAVENTFIQQYLGHTSGETTRTYQSINVKLRNAPKTNIEADAKISELIENDKENIKQHEELKRELENLKRDNRIYTEFINPRHRTTQEQKLQKLKALWERAKKDNVSLTYNTLKKDYRYGSRIIDEFRKSLRN
jgi:integrase